MANILARQYILQRQQTQNYICSFCFRVDLQLFISQCPCQKYFCQDCIHNRKCFICDQSIRIKETIKIKNKFYCPNNQKGCSSIFNQIKQFNHHIKDCQYSTPKQKSQFRKIVLYQCEFGHKLTLKNYYAQCKICQESRHCKSGCQVCIKQGKKQIYCFKCRPILCTKTRCPSNHLIEKRIGVSAVCDLCDRGSTSKSNISYQDRQCDFDICFFCHEYIPEEIVQVEDK